MNIKHSAAHVLEEAKKTRLHASQQVCDNICRVIRDSEKFAIPDNGKILDLSLSNFEKGLKELPIRLPYNQTTIEFVGVAGNRADKLIFPLEEIDGHICAYRVHQTNLGHGKQWYADDVRYDFLYDGTDTVSRLTWLSGAPNNQPYYEDMQAMLFGLIAEFCMALACRNVSHNEVIEPPRVLNEARKRKGKVPFHSYRVLTIAGGNGDKNTDRCGSHASPRIHLRRGHIRRLPSGPVWVNACVVGDKSKGIVTKDYRVQAR